MELLLILPTTYLITRAHVILKKKDLKHEMVIKPSSIFSDCGLAISLEKKDHTGAIEILHTNGVTQTASYIMMGKAWTSYDG